MLREFRFPGIVLLDRSALAVAIDRTGKPVSYPRRIWQGGRMNVSQPRSLARARTCRAATFVTFRVAVGVVR